MIEGSGSVLVPLTNGSGSRRPKTYGSYGSESGTLILDSNKHEFVPTKSTSLIKYE
jgi:hypothetical protein